MGAWESVSRVGGSYNPAALATGWAFDRRAGRAPDLLVFTDSSKRIVGFTSGTRRRPDLSPILPEAASDRVGWIAYLPAGMSSDVTAYLVFEDGRSLCEVGESHVPGTYLTAPASKAGLVVPGLQIKESGGWTRDSLDPLAVTVPNPTDTWSSRTVKSGAAVLRIGPVPCGSESSIGLPLITSTTASMTRVSVVERGTRRVLAEANPPPGLSAWDLWRLDVPAGASPMVCDYIVEDTDNDPGSWVAVGLPRIITR
jgi:hypothetical protein